MKRGNQMTKRIIVANFEYNSQAYEAFSKVKKAHLAKQIKGEQMAVVTHSEGGDHQYLIEDFLDFTGANKTSKAGTIGMLVGILAGPMGILLGWFGGSMFGASKDAQEVKKANTIFELLGKEISEGKTGLILITTEDDNRPLNQLIMYELGGNLYRFDYEEVEEELDKMQEAQEQASEETHGDWVNHEEKPNEEENN